MKMGVREYKGQILCDRRWPDGKRFTRIFPNKKQAEDVLKQIEASILNGTWPEYREKLMLRNRDPFSVTVEGFSETYMEEYATQRNKKRAWERKETAFRAINPVLGKLPLEQVMPAHLHAYVQRRKQKGKVTDSTINREITILKHLFNYAEECGIVESNPLKRFKLLREERTERMRFTDEQIDAVINAVRAECRPLFSFIRETGCRREEAVSLTHDQIQEGSRLVVFNHNTKSRRYRYVGLTDDALAAINALPRLGNCPFVFYNPKTLNRWRECRKEWEKARKEAGIPDLHVKDLRRHFAITLAEKGASMHDIQQALGHTSVATTENHYAQFSPEYSAKRILKVLQGGKPSGNKTESADSSTLQERPKVKSTG